MCARWRIVYLEDDEDTLVDEELGRRVYWVVLAIHVAGSDDVGDVTGVGT
jgi:hypothetical protein